MRRRHILPWLMVTVMWASPLLADERPLVEKAFAAWIEKAGLASTDVLTSEVPCGDELCLQFVLDPVVREHALPRMAELMAGFGISADVMEVEIEGGRDPMEVRLRVVTRTTKNETDATDRLILAANHVALLRRLAALNDATGQPARLAEVKDETPFYFIAGITITPKRSTVRLVTPPRAPVPELPHRLKGAYGCSCATQMAARRPVVDGPLARWLTYQLHCNWVCTDRAKPIE